MNRDFNWTQPNFEIFCDKIETFGSLFYVTTN